MVYKELEKKASFVLFNIVGLQIERQIKLSTCVLSSKSLKDYFLLSPLSSWLHSVCCRLLFSFCHLKHNIYTQEARFPVGLETDLQASFFSTILFHLEQLLYFV